MIQRLFLLCFFPAVLLSCTKLDAPAGERKRSDYPDLNYQDSLQIEEHQGSMLKWKMRALSLKRWPSRANQTTVYGVSVDLYDSTGAISAWIRADSALIFADGDRIQAYGSTRARSPKNMEISSDSLWIERSMNSIHTDAPVRILSPQGDLVSGIGLKSDLKLENWTLQKKVKAIFQNFGPRMDSADQPKAQTPVQTQPASPVMAPARRPDMDAPDVE